MLIFSDLDSTVIFLGKSSKTWSNLPVKPTRVTPKWALKRRCNFVLSTWLFDQGLFRLQQTTKFYCPPFSSQRGDTTDTCCATDKWIDVAVIQPLHVTWAAVIAPDYGFVSPVVYMVVTVSSGAWIWLLLFLCTKLPSGSPLPGEQSLCDSQSKFSTSSPISTLAHCLCSLTCSHTHRLAVPRTSALPGLVHTVPTNQNTAQPLPPIKI